MPMVRAIRLCQVDNSLRQEGETFEYEGPDNGNLENLDGTPYVSLKGKAQSRKLEPAEFEEPSAAPKKKWQSRAAKDATDAGLA